MGGGEIAKLRGPVQHEALSFGVSEQLGDAIFKLGCCKALGVGGRGPTSPGYKNGVSQSSVRNRAPDIPRRITSSIFDGTGPLSLSVPWPEAFGEEGFTESLSVRLSGGGDPQIRNGSATTTWSGLRGMGRSTRKRPKPKDNGGNQRDPEVRCGSAHA